MEMKKQLLSGHEAVLLEGEEKERHQKDWTGYKQGLVRLNPGRWLFPANYTNYADTIYDFQFKSSDVAIITYAKCGTTWTQEIVWNMRNSPNLDHPLAEDNIGVRSPFLEFDMFLELNKPGEPAAIPFLQEALEKYCPEKDISRGVDILLAESVPDPRTIKSHLPFSLLPPSMLDTCKVVYVARNPKDVVVSYHHHCRIVDVQGFVGTFEDYVDYFVKDDLVYGPYWLHLKEAWEKRNHPNLHIIFYEDLKANPLQEMKKLNTFLDTNLTEEQMEGIVKYTSFGNMKERFAKTMAKHLEDMAKKSQETQPNEVIKPKEKDEDDDKGIFRKGMVGDWKNKFTPDQDTKLNQWIQKNLGDCGINFKYGV